MSYSNASRSTTEFIADHFAHGLLMTVGFALTVFAAIVSATLRAPWALAVGLLGFTMFVAGRTDPPGEKKATSFASRSDRSPRDVTGFSAAAGE